MAVDSLIPASAPRRSASPGRAANDREGLLDLLLEATHDGILDWDVVRGVEAYNPRFLHLFGFDDESLADRPSHWRELVHPDDAERAARLLEDHLHGEWPFVGTFKMRHHCGGHRTILLRGAARRDAARRPVRMVIIFSDISEQVELEARHAALASALPDTLFRVARDGRVLELKRGDDQQHSPFRALEVGSDLERCLPANVVAALRAKFMGPAGDASAASSLEVAIPDGTATLHHEIRVVRSGADEWVCIVRDVTDRHALAERLLQSEKLGAIGQLAAGVAHEINTPLQYIGDNLHFASSAVGDLMLHGHRVRSLVETATLPERRGDVQRALEDSERERDIPYVNEALPRAIQRSLEGIGRVTTIVRALKTFAHPNGHEITAVDVAGLIESTVAVATNEWKFVADVDVFVDPLLPWVRCAGGEISQVLLNLVVNAAHAIGERVGTSGEKGRIGIEARRIEDDCELRVSDTGTGIPDHARSKVFDPFFTTKEIGKGTGQGLAMAHAAVVNHHGGSIRFETEVGVGTTFVVRLPLAGKAPLTRASASSSG
jgi:PAS domain S-box-containing protein